MGSFRRFSLHRISIIIRSVGSRSSRFFFAVLPLRISSNLPHSPPSQGPGPEVRSELEKNHHPVQKQQAQRPAFLFKGRPIRQRQRSRRVHQIRFQDDVPLQHLLATGRNAGIPELFSSYWAGGSRRGGHGPRSLALWRRHSGWPGGVAGERAEILGRISKGLMVRPARPALLDWILERQLYL